MGEVVTPDEALTAIWSWYWQAAHTRDRRRSETNKPDRSDQPVQARKPKQTVFSRLRSKFGFGQGKEKHEDPVEPVRPGVNPLTGAPESGSALLGVAQAPSGVELAMDAIVSPYQLACAISHTLVDDGDPDADEDWIAMSFKPRVQWTVREADVVQANTHRIAITAHRLAEQGLLDVRPISEKDMEMHDLVWESKAQLTIGFRITWQGFKAMNQFMDERPQLKRRVHLLQHAGRDVRAQAPEWLKRDFAHHNEAVIGDDHGSPRLDDDAWGWGGWEGERLTAPSNVPADGAGAAASAGSSGGGGDQGGEPGGGSAGP